MNRCTPERHLQDRPQANPHSGPRGNAWTPHSRPGCPVRTAIRILGSLFFTTFLLVGDATAQSLTFERDVRPILKANCFDCHGEGETLKGELDLRLRRFILRGGESGAGFVAGQRSTSLLFQKINSGEMPKREKKLTAHEIETIGAWIDQGAPTARAEPETLGTEMLITAEERAHWAFQPIRRPTIPEAADPSSIRTPIDAFIQESHKSHDLRFSPDANRITLIRRVYLDLTGLPPTPEQVARFVDDTSPDAYEHLVDRALGSPHYGERWARHWLDVAGYADSDGYNEADTPRAYAYKYRDYVIRSFNADKPFDVFIQEQIAGDEIATEVYTNREAAIQCPEAIENLTATAFLRMGPDGTAGGGDADTVRNQVVADTLKIVSTSLLGLTVGCAQCHDHRYDPIPQSDYYRLRAILEPAYDPGHWRTPAQRLVSLYTHEDREKAAAIDAEASVLTTEKNEKQKRFIAEALEKHLEKFEPELRASLKAAFETPPNDRTPEQKQLLADNPSVNISPGVLYQYNQKAADDLKAMDSAIAEVLARKPIEDFVQALTEVPGQVPETRLFHRGDPRQPKQTVLPGTLTVLAGPGKETELPAGTASVPTTGRRRAFASWVVSPANPLLARVWVNRIWMHHFGRGLVGTPADFGLTGEALTHPDLLEWLASVFSATDSSNATGHTLNWSLKRLHRLILTSTVYRQSSVRNPEFQALDPQNRWYWHKPIQRLDAEIIRDTMLAASGSLNRSLFGKPVPVREDLVGQVIVGVDKKQGDNKMPVEVPMGGEEYRRSVYVQVRRSRPLGFLNAFDAPAMELNCERRPSSTVAPQALMLMNSGFALDQAGRFARRLMKECPGDMSTRLEQAWLLAFARAPSSRERDTARAFLESQRIQVNGGIPPTETTDAKEAKSTTDTELQVWTNLCQALLSSNEFLYVD